MHPNPELELAAPAPELAPEPAARSAHAPATVPVPRWRRAVPLVTILPTIGLILSGLITWINVGPVDDFGARWMRAFFTALPVMPLGLLVMLAVSRLIGARLAAWHQIAGKGSAAATRSAPRAGVSTWCSSTSTTRPKSA